MTNEVIDNYLDKQGITDKDLGVDTLLFSEPSSNPYVLVISNSRKSLRDWIMVAWDLTHSTGPNNWVFHEAFIFQSACENIEASLGNPWETVRTELKESSNEK